MSIWPNAKLAKRLAPLYAANFFQGFVLWYVIEKLFMRQIGFDDAGIGVMAAVYSAIMLLIETPSGILADRWSRKGVLILAGIALAISSAVCGLSDSIPLYLLGAGLWGIFFALYSGMYDSVTYDVLLEEKEDTKQYDFYYGRLKIMHSAALIFGALLGALLASKLDIRDAYYWTVPLALASVACLLAFREPKLHKQQVAAPILQHVRDTFGAVLQKGQLAFILTLTVIVSTISYALFEFNQLWWIALAMPVAVFGPANALMFATIGLGGWVASRFNLHRKSAMYVSILVMIGAAIGLVLSRNSIITVICQIVISAGVIGLIVVFNSMLHDSLESRVRAGASSAVSTMTRVVLMVFALLFGFLSKELGVFAASWMFVVLLAICLVVVQRMFASQKIRAPKKAEAGETVAEESPR